MTRQTIAGLALRGQFAGARLCRRFRDDAIWHHHQWLRLRVSLDNLARMRELEGVALQQAVFSELTASGADELSRLRTSLTPSSADPGETLDDAWFLPADDAPFWAAAAPDPKSLQGRPCARGAP